MVDLSFRWQSKTLMCGRPGEFLSFNSDMPLAKESQSSNIFGILFILLRDADPSGQPHHPLPEFVPTSLCPLWARSGHSLHGSVHRSDERPLRARSRRSLQDNPEAAFKGRTSRFCPNHLLLGYDPCRKNDRFRGVLLHRGCRIAVGRFEPKAAELPFPMTAV